jgi:hypothetical protein
VFINGGNLTVGTQSTGTDIVFHTDGTTADKEAGRVHLGRWIMTGAVDDGVTKFQIGDNLRVVGNVTAGNVSATNLTNQFATLTANAAAQANQITGANAAIVTANTAMKSYVDAVTTAWTANAATQQVSINSLVTNANANTAAYLSNGISSNIVTTANVSAGNLRVGTTTYGNNTIYSSATATDITIGQLGATANLVLNRTTTINKDAYIAGNVSTVGYVSAQTYRGNTRNVGTLGAGGTLTIDYATDQYVFVNITGAITIAHTNIIAGRNVKVVVVNATGTNYAVNTGVADINTTGNNAGANLNSTRMGVYEFISFGTTTTTLYASVNK